MKRLVVIATKSKELQTRVIRSLNVIGHYGEVQITGTHDDLLYQVARGTETLVIVDKFFVGFNLKVALNLLRVINPNIKFLFVSEADGCKCYGYRLYRIGVEGFVWNGGHEKEFTQSLMYFFQHGYCYPEIIKEGIDNGELLDQKEYSTELTNSEIQVLLYRLKGCSYKEIPDIDENSARKMHLRAKRKQGLDTGWVDYMRFANELGFMHVSRGQLCDFD